MKAIRIGTPREIDRLEVVELPDPGKPAAGEVRVRIHASSLNFHDYGVVTGRLPASDGRIPMSDGSGVVEAVGDGVTEFKTGDSVVSCFFPLWQDGGPTVGDFATVPGDGIDGFACEVVVRAATAFTRIPKGYNHKEAATLTTAGLTAWRALVVNGRLKAGDTVLTLGTGGVSVFAVQFAKAMGATVISTSSSDAKLERLRAMGADHTINYKTDPKWGESVWKWTGGRGVDHVIEVGGPATLPQSVAAVGIGGHISLIGALTGLSGDFPAVALFRKQARMQGLIVGNRRQQQDMIQAIDVLGLKPVVDRVFPLEGLAEAFHYEKSGQHFGKICLEF